MYPGPSVLPHLLPRLVVGLALGVTVAAVARWAFPDPINPNTRSDHFVVGSRSGGG